MRRLFWKEWRERWIWALVWAGSIVGVALFAHGQAFCGERLTLFTPWQALPLVMALLVGAGSYAHELIGTRAQFTFSRPVPWWSLLLTKVLFGAVIAIGIPLVAALIFRLTCSEQFQQFATLSHLLTGALTIAVPLFALYLFGMACSTVIPGLAGSLLTLAAVAVVLIAFCLLPPICEPPWESWSELGVLAQYLGILLGIWLAVCAAGIALTRCSLPLGTDERVKRFVPTFACILTAGWLLGLLLPQPWALRVFTRWEQTGGIVSPQGDYALVHYERCVQLNQYLPADFSLYTDPPMRREVIDMRTGEHVLTIPVIKGNGGYIDWQWATNDIAYYYSGYSSDKVHIVRPKQREVVSVDFLAYRIRLSPGGTILATMRSKKSQRRMTQTEWEFLDLQSGLIRSTITNDDPSYYWWEAPDKIGYIDNKTDQQRSFTVPL